MASTSMSPMASPPGTALNSPPRTGASFNLSLVAPDEPQDRMKVYNPATVEALAAAGSAHPSQTSSIARQPQRRAASAASAQEMRRAEFRAQNRELLRYKHEQQLQKTLARHRHGREKKKEEEHEKFEELYETLVNEEQSFVDDVKEFLQTQARHEVRKREALHREWDEAVYQKVQADIDRQLAKRSVAEISARRYALMDDYVRVSNTKAYGLFRDIIIPEEYDPMIAHDNPLKYDSRVRFDPCKLELRMHAPDGLLSGSKSGGFSRGEPPSHRFPPTMWDKLEATPHGRFNKMMSAPMSAEKAATLKSSVVNDHFNVIFGREVIDREFPKGKRCFPKSSAGGGHAEGHQLGSADEVIFGHDIDGSTGVIGREERPGASHLDMQAVQASLQEI